MQIRMSFCCFATSSSGCRLAWWRHLWPPAEAQLRLNLIMQRRRNSICTVQCPYRHLSERHLQDVPEFRRTDQRTLWSRHPPLIVSLATTATEAATWSLVWARICSLQRYGAYRDGGRHWCRGLDRLSLSHRSRRWWPFPFADVLALLSLLSGSATRFDRTYVALSVTELYQLGTYQSSSASWTEIDLLVNPQFYFTSFDKDVRKTTLIISALQW